MGTLETSTVLRKQRGKIYATFIQDIPFKTGLAVERNQTMVLSLLVFGRLDAHSYRMCWKLDFCE
jgi:hypothetical protein